MGIAPPDAGINSYYRETSDTGGGR
jgi:hypothetical protein